MTKTMTIAVVLVSTGCVAEVSYMSGDRDAQPKIAPSTDAQWTPDSPAQDGASEAGNDSAAVDSASPDTGTQDAGSVVDSSTTDSGSLGLRCFVNGLKKLCQNGSYFHTKPNDAGGPLYTCTDQNLVSPCPTGWLCQDNGTLAWGVCVP